MNKSAIVTFALIGGICLVQAANAQNQAAEMAATIMTTWTPPAEGQPARWTYEQGVVWRGLEECWYNTGDARYFRYIQQYIDRVVDNEGNISTYKMEEFNLDNILCGRLLLMLYKVTGQEKYYKALKLLRRQLQEQPRTLEGGFWHKKKYENQVWLDGLYMAQPFFAEYAGAFHEDSVYADIVRQFVKIEEHVRDPETGLLYHGWDESRKERWADPKTGHSPNFWARAMGWYGMALVDVLDAMPAGHAGAADLKEILLRFASAVSKAQDPTTGCWWDVLDKPHAEGNYLEASASCMMVYTLAKAVREGWLPAGYATTAQKGWQGILKQFVYSGSQGALGLHGTVSVSGLGGDPYRDGSYAYYTKEKVVDNDPKGVGAFLLAAVEMDRAATQNLGKGRTVLLDYYFNNEHHKDITGATVRYHYTWEDQANSGYSLWGQIFRRYGMRTDSLSDTPSSGRLKKASIYIIVDPDNEKESPSPNYPSQKEIASIYDWVKAGGVLVLMSNDSGNAEFPHFNRLTERFGIHFNEDSRNHVQGNNFAQGAFVMSGHDSIFKTAAKVYIKELSTLRLQPPAVAHLTDKGDNIMAIAHIGKGTVFAVGDPWFYNEYLDGRKLPAEYENFNAATDLTKWLIGQTH